MTWFPDGHIMHLRNNRTDKCLDVTGGSSLDGALIQQLRCIDDNYAQMFGLLVVH